ETINLSFLLEHERETILGVLKRDEYLKKVEDKRIRKLKNELLEVRRKGGNRHSDQDNSRVCVRCQKSLGFIFDRGELCQSCKLRVCSACRVVGADGQWKCSVCAKIAELRIVTGEWFFEERAKRFKQSNLGTDVVRQSILHKFPDQPQENEEKKPDVPVCSTNGHKSVFSRPRKIGRVIRAVTKGEITFGKDGGERNRGSEAESPRLRGDKSAPCSESMTADCSGDTGLENCMIIPASESVPEDLVKKHCRKPSGTPSIAVSRVSLSSGNYNKHLNFFCFPDRSRSEIDLSESFSEGNEDTLSIRSKSVPSALDQELGYLDETEEDIDDIVASCYPRKHEHMTSGLSTTFKLLLTTVLIPFTSNHGNSVLGEILLSINYVYKTGALNILVKSCRNLAIADERKQRTDP
ncbi:SYTL5 protein, partial [Oxylabes madagascariensis]|nr:SYTL5 protein [Oxylabes madagascariensis]